MATLPLVVLLLASGLGEAHSFLPVRPAAPLPTLPASSIDLRLDLVAARSRATENIVRTTPTYGARPAAPSPKRRTRLDSIAEASIDWESEWVYEDELFHKWLAQGFVSPALVNTANLPDTREELPEAARRGGFTVMISGSGCAR